MVIRQQIEVGHDRRRDNDESNRFFFFFFPVSPRTGHSVAAGPVGRLAAAVFAADTYGERAHPAAVVRTVDRQPQRGGQRRPTSSVLRRGHRQYVERSNEK